MNDKVTSVDMDKELKLAFKDIISDNKHMADEYSYFVVFYRATTLHLVIHHIVGYKKYPSNDDILYNYTELETDDDFKLSPDVLKTLDHKVIYLKGA